MLNYEQYKDNYFSVVHGDCLEKLKDVETDSIDLVIADLPYGSIDCKWDVKLDLKLLWDQLLRVGKENAVFIFFCDYRLSVDLYLSNTNYFRYNLIMVKSRATGFQSTGYRPMEQSEYMQVFSKKAKSHTYNPQFTKGKPYVKRNGPNVTVKNISRIIKCDIINDGYRNPTNIKHYTNDDDCIYNNNCYDDLFSSVYYVTSISNTSKLLKQGIKYIYHSTQKPQAILNELILTYSNAGDTVLDPTAGAGSTLFSALKNNRNCIVIEKEQDFINATYERLESFKKDVNLVK